MSMLQAAGIVTFVSHALVKLIETSCCHGPKETSGIEIGRSHGAEMSLVLLWVVTPYVVLWVVTVDPSRFDPVSG